MKLEILFLQKKYFIIEKFCKQTIQEKTIMDVLFEEYVHFERAQHTIKCLEKEKKE